MLVQRLTPDASVWQEHEKAWRCKWRRRRRRNFRTALNPLYFGASAEGIALRHLLPDIYEAWDEMCLAFRYMYICLIMIIMYEALSY